MLIMFYKEEKLPYIPGITYLTTNVEAHIIYKPVHPSASKAIKTQSTYKVRKTLTLMSSLSV